MNNKKFIPILIFLFFSAFKVLPLLFKGFVAVPFDLLIGAYYPWLNQSWGFPTGVPVKNNVLSDVISQLYPWLVLAKKQILSGHLPLWNPTSIFGYPYFANYHSSLFYPTNILLLLGPTSIMRTFQLWLQVFLALYFMFIFLRQQKLSQLAAYFGSIVFAFSGLMMTDFEFASAFKAITWLPLILYFYNLLSFKFSSYRVAGLSFAYSLLLLSGHFQTSLYVSVLLALLLLKDVLGNKRLFLYKTVGLSLGALLAAPQLFPTMELLKNSIRVSDPYIQQVNYGILPLKHLITLFFAPDYFGNPATGNYFGFWNYRESIGYLGISTSIFILYGLLSKKFLKIKFAFLTTIILVFFEPFARLPYLLHLPLIQTSAASRLLFLTAFFGATLAASGIDELFKTKSKFKFKLLPLIGINLLFLIIFAITVKIHNQISVRNLVIPGVLLLISSFSILMSSLALFRPYRTIIIISLIVLLSVDLLRFHYKFNTFFPSDFDFPATPTTTFLQQNKGLISQTSTEVLPPNTWTPYLINSTQGYDPLYPIQNGLYLQAINQDTSTPSTPGRYLDRATNFDSPLWTVAGLRYLVNLDKGESDSSLSIPKSFREVFNDGPINIYENESFTSLVYIDHQPTTVGSKQEVLDLLRKSKSVEVVTENLLSQDYSQNPNTITPIEADADIDGSYRFKFNALSSGVLFLPTSHYPGWNARLDGKKITTFPANYLFTGIEVSQGYHDLVFVYFPESLLLGLIASLGSLLTLGLIVLRYKYYES